MLGIGKEAVTGEGERKGSGQRQQEYLVVGKYASCIKVRGVKGQPLLHATPRGNMK